MATVTTFTTLQEEIRRYIERGNVADTSVYDQIPYLINNTEREIARALKILGFINVVTSNFVAGTSVYEKPDRWRDTVSMTYIVNSERISLFPRAYEYCRRYWPNPATQGTPKFYADYDYTHWLITPTPSANSTWEVLYYQLPQLLDNANQTNWTTEYAGDVLLYGTLLACAPFLKNDERVPTWQSFYNAQLGALNGEDLQRIIDRTVTRQEA
jgi:hypothetical protein